MNDKMKDLMDEVKKLSTLGNILKEAMNSDKISMKDKFNALLLWSEFLYNQTIQYKSIIDAMDFEYEKLS